MSRNLKNKTLNELEKIIVSLGQKKYLAEYIFSFIHSAGITQLPKITPLSKAFRKELDKEGYYISQIHILDRLADRDGTIKYLFELGDGEQIETVFLLDGRRKTLCVSTQIGCAMGCAFCATAKVKLRRNLTAGEIVDQVNIVETLNGCDARLVKRRTMNASPLRRSGYEGRTDTSRANDRRNTRITNVVYMGMGEPLLNYNNVVRSVRILNHAAGRNIGIRHLTISTCGILPAIRKLANEDIQPRLSVSLNATDDAMRTRLMPINAKYPIAELLKAVRFYQEKSGQRVTFEYVMIKRVNDSARCAEMLVKRLRDIRCNVNLIEYNPHPHCEFAASNRASIERFVQVLKGVGIETTVRFKKGQHINAACGQLGAGWIDIKNKTVESL